MSMSLLIFGIIFYLETKAGFEPATFFPFTVCALPTELLGHLEEVVNQIFTLLETLGSTSHYLPPKP